MDISYGHFTMILSSMAIFLTALIGADNGSAAPLHYAQMSIREQIIIRLPAQPRTEMLIKWKEGKSLKCVPIRAIAGSTQPDRDSVDLVFHNNGRVRAKFEHSCPALDYYRGFYIIPNRDGMICADRDIIRSRVGGMCEIDQLKILKPIPKD